MKIEVIAKFLLYNAKDNMLTIKLEQFNEKDIALLEQACEERNLFKVWFNFTKRRFRSNDQLKRLWVDITKILQKLEVPLSAENKNIFYEEVVKRTIFPVRYVNFGSEKDFPVIPSSSELSVEEMSHVIETLRDRYQYLKIDWDSHL